jgi:hypothetical protein
MSVKRYVIPSYDQDPTDEMIEWMAKFNPSMWDGDESGVCLHLMKDGVEYDVLGGPGEFLCGDLDMGTMWIEDALGKRKDIS